MVWLLINTATEESYISLYKDRQKAAGKRWLAAGVAGKKLMAIIDDMLGENGWHLDDVDRVAVHSGPGRNSSWLRVGATVGSVLSLATGAELVNVDGKDENEMVKEAMRKPAEAAIIIKYQGRGYG